WRSIAPRPGRLSRRGQRDPAPMPCNSTTARRRSQTRRTLGTPSSTIPSLGLSHGVGAVGNEPFHQGKHALDVFLAAKLICQFAREPCLPILGFGPIGASPPALESLPKSCFDQGAHCIHYPRLRRNVATFHSK